MLKGRRIVVGVTGSIAAYKAADLVSKLAQAGAEVDVVLTESAQQFVTPMTFHSLTGREVYTDIFEVKAELQISHVELSRRADAVLIAPASATTIARIAHGLADNLLSLTVLATKAPVLLAPAMDSQMYENAATQANLALLRERGMTIVGPEEGRLATGRRGPGRLVDTETLLGALRQTLGRNGDLAGRKVVVSAGGTQEPIDPVRYVSNYSSGKMGYAVAEAARDRGAKVVIVSAPVSLPAPYGVEVVSVRTAEEMRDAVVRACADADALVMAAAVADYRPASAAEQKIKRAKEGLSLELVRTPDILGEVKGPLRVGFAAESEKLEENAADKLRRKGLDLIVANDITAPGSGFGSETNQVTIIDKSGKAEKLPLLSKYEVAHRIFDRVAPLLKRRARR
ncbi:MAG: bifunctional phosphopantothenoylcysteine decarboxylase/phosphopantothenate--cysteine ligase CoaBC [Dehalococcoidia bacterium]|nr:bifunctional phosphopantothenoylcysteine decarboxylase/phosphopantothenate--cysteine ligase CoaBC [Dehalococcoidia bacterium]